ncbi:MAG: hypothetical protein L0206_20005 [Actinobacteria bacterium]|nr:hypothetical protein [Actinomycetota bacterium]
MEPRGAQAQVRVPGVERQVAVLHPLERQADHRQVHPAVVDVQDRQDLGPQDPEVEPDGERDEPQRSEVAARAVGREPLEAEASAGRPGVDLGRHVRLGSLVDLVADRCVAPRGDELPILHPGPSLVPYGIPVSGRR